MNLGTTHIPLRLDQLSDQLLFVVWNTGEKFSVPFFDLRFECPCASCVDEMTGQRRLTREQVKPDVKPTGIRIVGRYAAQISWNDGHSTGMYHFERLFELCKKYGKLLPQPASNIESPSP